MVKLHEKDNKKRPKLLIKNMPKIAKPRDAKNYLIKNSGKVLKKID